MIAYIHIKLHSVFHLYFEWLFEIRKTDITIWLLIKHLDVM